MSLKARDETRAKVGIVVKPKNARSSAVAEELSAYLQRNNIEFLVDTESVSVFHELGIREVQTVSRREIVELVDVVASLGGDGTFISVARFGSSRSANFIGVNVGTLGFLTEITPSELFSVLELALQGKAKVQKRAILSAQLKGREGNEARFSALNDVVIAKGALARIFGVTLFVDDIEAAYIRGDGVVISSPSGSTAYSLAAGGSIVHPQVDALLVTPICPHSLTSRPLIIPGTSKVSLKLDDDASDRSAEVYLTVDGQEGMKIAGGGVVEVRTSTDSLKLITSPSRSYFETLSAKLKWATHDLSLSPEAKE